MKKPPQIAQATPEVALRLYWLERLIDDEYGGGAKVFEDKTGIKMSQVNQWFSGYRALRENALRRIEHATGKERGWFDRPIQAADTAPPQPAASNAMHGAGAPNELRRALAAMASTISKIAPLLQPNARAALSRWASGEATADETAATLEALIEATAAMPPMRPGLGTESAEVFEKKRQPT